MNVTAHPGSLIESHLSNCYSYRLGFSTQVLKLSSGELGKIAVVVVVVVAVAVVAGIVRTKTLRDQKSADQISGFY